MRSPLAFVADHLFRRTLHEKGPSLTIARLCTSRHLVDLQWIAFFALLVTFAALFIAVCTFNFREFNTHSGVASAFAAAGTGVLAWAYQSASKRIGVVDLFACEITALCREALVVDFARSSVDRAKRQHDRLATTGAATAPSHDAPDASQETVARFTGEESYTPVYDNELSELQPLDVEVVTYVTQFYTYRKAMMDFLRANAAAASARERDALTGQMIYMQFLMYESGRLAIEQLVEFAPDQAESLVNILCSELVAYAFLQIRFEDDYRGQRLRLCREHYKDIVAKLVNTIAQNDHPVWEKARTTAPELVYRYGAMCSDLGLDPGKFSLEPDAQSAGVPGLRKAIAVDQP